MTFCGGRGVTVDAIQPLIKKKEKGKTDTIGHSALTAPRSILPPWTSYCPVHNNKDDKIAEK